VIPAGLTVAVHDQSAVSSARRMATECAETLRLSSGAIGRAALAATELATNLVKHARGGSMIFAWQNDRPKTLTMISIDKGGGIANVQSAMRDGYSTAGSPGTGLGAVSRAAASFDVYSVEGRGTVVICHVGDDDPQGAVSHAKARGLQVGGICVPKHGETQPGDSWVVTHDADAVTVTVIDGLGHGPAAATAAVAAVRVAKENAGRPIEEIMHAAHGALRPTRGAAMAIARIYPSRRKLDFVGIGNIGAAVLGDAMRRTVSIGGIVGHEMRKVQTFSYPWEGTSQLIMYSDGINSSWGVDNYPGLATREPDLIAAVLYRDFCRGTDDATVVVAKNP
jgi:anti-sigma regulatory factor (Ser/Thr protein kinase)